MLRRIILKRNSWKTAVYRRPRAKLNGHQWVKEIRGVVQRQIQSAGITPEELRDIIRDLKK